MTHLYATGIPLQVLTDKQGQPLRFTWQERTHQIDHIVQRWQVDTEWWREHIWRAYYAVTTTDGLLCVLYNDLTDGVWYLSKLYD